VPTTSPSPARDDRQPDKRVMENSVVTVRVMQNS
jgi:hypothetical protein